MARRRANCSASSLEDKFAVEAVRYFGPLLTACSTQHVGSDPRKDEARVHAWRREMIQQRRRERAVATSAVGRETIGLRGKRDRIPSAFSPASPPRKAAARFFCRAAVNLVTASLSAAIADHQRNTPSDGNLVLVALDRSHLRSKEGPPRFRSASLAFPPPFAKACCRLEKCEIPSSSRITASPSMMADLTGNFFITSTMAGKFDDQSSALRVSMRTLPALRWQTKRKPS